MKNILMIIKNHITIVFIGIGFIVFVYFGYQIIMPIIEKNLMEKSFTDNFDNIGKYFK